MALRESTASLRPHPALRATFPRPVEGFSGSGKVSGSTAKFAGVPLPLGGAVAQRLRGFKSAEPEKRLKDLHAEQA